jgi:pantoate kinase
VNGDPNYVAATTRTALEFFLGEHAPRQESVLVEQLVQVPIGYGFGASAASALSAVLATSAALGIGIPKQKVAYYAHAADIVSQTGLGTVSAISNLAGAGIITKAGSPERARFLEVPVPRGFKVVTASIAPYRKSKLLSSRTLTARANRLGRQALESVVRDPSLSFLLEAGRIFAAQLGTETEGVRRLVETALENGALGASQNMLGYAVHAVAQSKAISKILGAFRADLASPIVDSFEFGRVPAHVLHDRYESYPTVTSSLV